MVRRTNSECTLPSTLTAYGGSGCCSIAMSSDGISVAAATDDYINIYPVCSIWMPCYSIPIPGEIPEFNMKLHNRICNLRDCKYKNKYTPYVKPGDRIIKRKFGKRRIIPHGTIQMLQFYGEQNEYLIAIGPFILAVYDLTEMENNPIMCFDMRYFGVHALEYPYPLQASFATLNIYRNYMYYDQPVSCMDFVFSTRPYVPTYFRVLFNENERWWVVDCRSTMGIIPRRCLDDDIPYRFYNHDNSRYLNQVNNLFNMKEGFDTVYNQDKDSDEVEGDQEEMYPFDTFLNTTSTTYNNSDDESDDDEKEDEEEDEEEEEEQFGYSAIFSDDDMYETGSSTSQNSMQTDVNRVLTNTNDTDNTTTNNETDTFESDSNPSNSDDKEDCKSNSSQNTDKESASQMEVPSPPVRRGGKPSNNWRWIDHKGAYHPFCILERKVDFSPGKLKEFCKSVNDGFLSYRQEFVLVTFVPTAYVLMVNLSTENRFYVRRGNIKHSKSGITSSYIMSDLMVPNIGPKIHTFVARKFGGVCAMLSQDRFYVMKYKIPATVNTTLQVDDSNPLVTNYRRINSTSDSTPLFRGSITENGLDINTNNYTDLTDTIFQNKLDVRANSNSGDAYPHKNNFKMETDEDTPSTSANSSCNLESDTRTSFVPNKEVKFDLDTESNSVNKVRDRRNYRIYVMEEDSQSYIKLHYCHYDPVLKLRYTVATFDLSKSEGYLAVCTNYTSQWGLQIFSLAPNTGVDALRLVLDSSKCKGFTQIQWLPFTKKLLVISRLNGELFQLEPKVQRSWVGLISNFVNIEKNVEYIESEDIFDIVPTKTSDRPVIVKQDFVYPQKEFVKDDRFKDLDREHVSYRYPFYNVGFSIIAHTWFKIKAKIRIGNKKPIYHSVDPEHQKKYKSWYKYSKLL